MRLWVNGFFSVGWFYFCRGDGIMVNTYTYTFGWKVYMKIRSYMVVHRELFTHAARRKMICGGLIQYTLQYYNVCVVYIYVVVLICICLYVYVCVFLWSGGKFFSIFKKCVHCTRRTPHTPPHNFSFLNDILVRFFGVFFIFSSRERLTKISRFCSFIAEGFFFPSRSVCLLDSYKICT